MLWTSVIPPGLLADRLSRTSRAIKVALMEQKLLAGSVTFTAEALFDVGVDQDTGKCPDSRGVSGVGNCPGPFNANESGPETDPEITYLNEGKQANPFWVYGREGESCVRCSATVSRFTQGGRSTFFCAACQGNRG